MTKASLPQANTVSREPLLEGKWRIPVLRSDRVARTHLLNQLQEGLSLGRSVTLVSAPAGFGKTTLLSEWAGLCNRPVAWLSLEESENDASIFLKYLVRALSPAVADIHPSLLSLLESPQPNAMQGVLTSLLNALGKAPAFVLVLDDFHVVTSPGARQTLESIVTHMPETMHLAIGTREDPAIPLAKLRARGSLTELRESDLRFTSGEVEDFLNRCMSLSLPPSAANALEKRTEGWIAGLQLAAFAMQKERGRAEEFIAAFSGDHRFIMDYLIAEVLDRLSPQARDFLRQTSILDRLTAPLCDAVTGGSDSQSMLEKLEASNIFLMPLDGQRTWYRYHRLFAEFLRARLSPADEIELHERAAAWLEAQRMPTQAIRHALIAGALTGRFDTAERIIMGEAEDAIQQGRVETLLAWLNDLPEARIRSHPELTLQKGWALSLSGDFDGAAKYADLAERACADHAELRRVRGKTLLLQAFIAMLRRGDFPETIRLARSAMEAFGAEQSPWLSMAYWLLAEPHERMGQVAEAIQTLQQSKLVIPPSGARAFTDLIDLMLIYDLNLAGRRRDALILNREAIATRQELAFAPAYSLLLGRLVVLLYEENQLGAANDASQRIVAQGDLEPFTSFARGMTADLLFAQGDTGNALAALEQAIGYARQSGLADEGSLLAAQANLRLRLGDLESVARWATASHCAADEAPQAMRMETQLTYARYLLALRSYDIAGKYLERIRAYLDERAIRRPLLTAHVLSALCADHAGKRKDAVDFLGQAVRMAGPEGYVRAFLDEDRSLLEILPMVRSIDPPFVDEIFSAALSGNEASPAQAPNLAEPLSGREIEILRLIADGLSNADIAARLVIAVATVKRHINNIYDKLAVKSRTQAIAKAKQLGLLPKY
jgi:LuxR family transcriptional regulator, maltose regulon positive regulatory protein